MADDETPEMKRKRIRHADDLQGILQGSGGFLEQIKDLDVSHDDDLLDQMPHTAALELGRSEGFHLSDVEKHLLEKVLDAFDQGALNELSAMQRTCFTDVVISGDTYDVVSARYRISRGAVQTHIKRAAARIRKVIANAHD